ncbi:MAG: hypothetical protein KL840_08460 [Aquamicrobium sp.]|nr:hypothetical protein [Aquamicrobium sp.]
MSIAPAFFLLFLITVTSFYWFLPPGTGRARALLLIGASAVAVFLISPVALVVAVAAAVGASLMSARLAERRSQVAMILAIAAVLGVLVMTRVALPTELTFLDLTGSAFFCLKAIAIIADAYRFGRQTSLTDSLLLVLFFPTYEAGPIEQPRTLNQSSCQATFDFERFIGGFGRIAIGLVKQAYLAPIIVLELAARISPWEGDELVAGGQGMLALWMLLKWLQIYIMFSGYSDVAIGAARLMGIQIRENFKLPFMAENLQDFWKRWHISLIDFMSMYVYQPFVRRTGWRYRGIMVLFLLTGLWHAFNLQYLLWGALHGCVMATLARWQRSETGDRFRAYVAERRVLELGVGAASRVGTLFFVAWVSAIGGSETWEMAVQVLTFGGL